MSKKPPTKCINIHFSRSQMSNLEARARDLDISTQDLLRSKLVSAMVQGQELAEKDRKHEFREIVQLRLPISVISYLKSVAEKSGKSCQATVRELTEEFHS